MLKKMTDKYIQPDINNSELLPNELVPAVRNEAVKLAYLAEQFAFILDPHGLSPSKNVRELQMQKRFDQVQALERTTLQAQGLDVNSGIYTTFADGYGNNSAEFLSNYVLQLGRNLLVGDIKPYYREYYLRALAEKYRENVSLLGLVGTEVRATLGGIPTSVEINRDQATFEVTGKSKDYALSEFREVVVKELATKPELAKQLIDTFLLGTGTTNSIRLPLHSSKGTRFEWSYGKTPLSIDASANVYTFTPMADKFVVVKKGESDFIYRPIPLGNPAYQKMNHPQVCKQEQDVNAFLELQTALEKLANVMYPGEVRKAQVFGFSIVPTGNPQTPYKIDGEEKTVRALTKDSLSGQTKRRAGDTTYLTSNLTEKQMLTILLDLTLTDEMLYVIAHLSKERKS